MSEIDKDHLLRQLDQILYYNRVDSLRPEELLEQLPVSYRVADLKETSAFIKDIEKSDGKDKTLSRFDVLWALVDQSKSNNSDWWHEIFSPDWSLSSSIDERLQILAAPLLQGGQYGFTAALKSRALFVDIAKSKAETSTSNLLASLHIYAESLIKNSTAEITFKKYFGISWHDFSNNSIKKRAEMMTAAVERGLPDTFQCKQIIVLLSGTEYNLLTELCFLNNTEASFALFEANPYPFPPKQIDYGARGMQSFSDSSEYQDYWEATHLPAHFSFPSLNQNVPYEMRMQKLRAFLGEPTLSKNTELTDSQTGTAFSTQLQKFNLVGNTECFLLDSHKPGPVTLVFSPHFHEPNPRRAFHWMKDLPLQSGAVIFMPEANRAMHDMEMDTYAMNAIFDKTLKSSRVDYLVLRRIEYMLGLADGLIGVHDSQTGPFFISDRGPQPIPSQWVTLPPDPALQKQGVHWQLTQQAREIMKGMRGLDADHNPKASYRGITPLDQDPSFQLMATPPFGATAYMNARLKKPAMTFEGNMTGNHGPLHAAAQYALLKAYGHQIDPAFEAEILEEPLIERDIYEGLPPHN